jgi:hypothetical protein
MDILGGPSLLRPYEFWHPGGSLFLGATGSSKFDAAFDLVRAAGSDDEYRRASQELQKAAANDPPAIYLAWGQRSRAVSKRFNVPAAEPGRDVLATLRLWKPSADERRATQN